MGLNSQKTAYVWPALIVAVFAGLAACIHLPFSLNHDAAWHFYTSFQVIQGAEIGVDIFDINPPMSMWLFSIPAHLTHLTGLPAPVMFKVFTLLTAALSIFAVLSLEEFDDAAPRRLGLMAMLLGGTLFLLPGYDFGQREHFTLMLTLPYVCSVIHRAQGRKLSLGPAVLIGIAAAVGVGIKPYFLALPVFMELWLMIKSRRLFTALRPVSISLAATLMLYLAAVYIFAPGYMEHVLPAALSNYGGYNAPAAEVILAFLRIIVPFAALLLIANMLFDDIGRQARFQGLMSASAAFLLAAILQKKGWAYQILPSLSYLGLAIGFVLCESKLRASSGRVPARTFAALGLALLICLPSVKYTRESVSPVGTQAAVEALSKIIKAQERRSPNRRSPKRPVSVSAFITSPRYIHPAIQETNAEWIHASGVNVYLPGALRAASANPAPANIKAVLAASEAFDRDMVQTLMAKKPDIIFIDQGPYKLGIADTDFAYLPYYFARYPELYAFMAGYEELAPIAVFRVFVPKDP